MTAKPERLDFAGLVDAIRQVHQRLTAQAGRAVNVSLTLRNWLIGGYIAEFELHGADRAMYGERLLDELSSALRKVHVSSAGRRQLYGFLAFYRAYPEIGRSLPAQFRHLLPAPARTERKPPVDSGLHFRKDKRGRYICPNCGAMAGTEKGPRTTT